ncbi:MAG: xanthine dehydrogenase family protein molybdopterin-binding subunit [Micromonosporaceae bacterium]
MTSVRHQATQAQAQAPAADAGPAAPPVAASTAAPAVATGVGQPAARADGESRVRGVHDYVADLPTPQALHVAVHRATRPHARITSIQVEDAAAMPGVVSVITGQDLHRRFGQRVYTGPAFNDQPPLAIDRVRYVGEPVVAVVADDLAAARAAADEVIVEYADLEPVLHHEEAIGGEAGTPRAFVHDELRPSSVFGDLKHLQGQTGTNVCYQFNLRKGDVEAAAAAASTRVSGDYWCPPTSHVPIELPCTAAWVSDGRLEIVTTTQTPSYVRQMAADMIGLPLSRVRVRTAALGGGFGAKMYDRLEPLAAALAWTLRQPVRLTATREETFLITTRHGAAVSASMTADEQGRITSAQAEVAYDTGAYADVGPRITGKSGMVAAGPYRIDNIAIRSRCVYTNKPSAGPFRGFGVPQVVWAHESLVDELARQRDEDPAEFRRRNLLAEGDPSATGTLMHSAELRGCLDAVCEALDWATPLRRDAGAADAALAPDATNPDAADPDAGDPAASLDAGRFRRGRGVAVGKKAVLTPTVANAVLQLNQDASASLMISTVEMGQGSNTIMAQIVSEVLQIPADRIRVVAPDTDVTPYDTITAGSRSTYHTGNAVRLVAEKMADQLRDLAANALDAEPDQLVLTADGVATADGARAARIPDLVLGRFGARGATLTASADFTTSWVGYDKETGQTPKSTEHWFAAAAGAQVTVDTHTGRVRVEHLAVAGDVGRAVNPALVEQQLTGAAITGIGHALFDEMVFDSGQLINGTLLDYQLPTVHDLPDRITPLIVESPHRTGPYGAKGVGETGILAIAPAIANAVRDAVGVRVTRLPLTPERVLDAIDAAATADQSSHAEVAQ